MGEEGVISPFPGGSSRFINQSGNFPATELKLGFKVRPVSEKERRNVSLVHNGTMDAWKEKGSETSIQLGESDQQQQRL